MKARSGDCRAQLAALFAYLDDELAPARRRTVEKHLHECECCGDMTHGLERAVALCRTLGVRVPASVHKQAQARARALAAALTAVPANPRTRIARRRTR